MLFNKPSPFDFSSLTKITQHTEKFPTHETRRIRNDITIKLSSSWQVGRQVELQASENV